MNCVQGFGLALLTGAFVAGLAGCGGGSGDTQADAAAETTPEAAGAPINRVDIPPAVRQNLGITFVEVEARLVEQTLRVPGRFEYLPTAHREYRTMLPGRVEILVEQYQPVTAGTPLYRIDAPGWRELQQEISEAEATVERTRTRSASFGPLREAHHNHERLLEQTIEVRRERVEQLEGVMEAGGGHIGELTEARAAVTTAQADLAEVLETEAELEADEAETAAAHKAALAHHELLMATAAAFVGLPVEDLASPVGDAEDARPLWHAMQMIEVRAQDEGVVESLGVTNGAWADEKSVVVSVVRPERVRFRAVGLQSDLGRLRDGLTARIVSPSPTRAAGAVDLTDSMEGTLRIGLNASAEQRTIDLVVTPERLADWARAGVSAQLEIVTDSNASATLAVPLAAVQRDGLVPVLFRRDPADANKAIRINADLGVADGRWVVVHSGLGLGDEVVLDGAFQLMLASAQAGGQQEGGHFHSDGAFHAGEDE